MSETWTTDDAAAFCGITASRFRAVVASMGVTAIGRDLDTGQKLYAADDIRDMQQRRPGQGRRTDLQRPGR